MESRDIDRLEKRMESLEQALIGRIDRACEAMSKQAEVIAHQSGVCEACQSQIKQHHRELYGNGRSGLIATIAAHETWIEEIGDPAKQASRAGKVSVVAIITAVGSAIAAALAAIAGK